MTRVLLVVGYQHGITSTVLHTADMINKNAKPPELKLCVFMTATATQPQQLPWLVLLHRKELVEQRVHSSHSSKRAYGKAGNGNETETGNGNWKWKENGYKKRTIIGAMFSSQCAQPLLLHSTQQWLQDWLYESCALPLLMLLCFVITAFSSAHEASNVAIQSGSHVRGCGHETILVAI